jgi:hypothetical protein
MEFDSYRWQDHVHNPYRRGIDLTLTGLFALAFSVSAVLQPGGDRQPAQWSDLAPQASQTAMNQALPDKLHTAAPPDCGA